ncbi:MAG: hypothetical protein EOO73_21920 [Myxococcales bacterium]|nr:MAG: hypothetical protein EOO73_21920 [Myxococcales bacterium]
MAKGMRKSLDLSANLETFFHDVVDDAMRKKQLAATEAAEYYLVSLLTDYARPDARSCEALERPLTLLLDEALHAPGQERFERLRVLGDGVLYVSGFFAPHLETRGVEVRYVTSVGARAYDGAGRMLRGSSGEAAPDLFFELAENFQRFAELLSDIAERLSLSSTSSSTGVLKLYERWLKTGSETLGTELLGRGVLPVRGQGGLH